MLNTLKIKTMQERLEQRKREYESVASQINIETNPVTTSRLEKQLEQLDMEIEEINGELAELRKSLADPGKNELRQFSESDIDPSEEIQSLKRQLKNYRRSLLLVQEKMAEFIDPRSIPPEMQENEHRLKEKITEIEARLAALG